MTALLDSACPCQSSKSYKDCCGRFHTHAQFPETAEQLMRSRYAAYVLKNCGHYRAEPTGATQRTSH